MKKPKLHGTVDKMLEDVKPPRVSNMIYNLPELAEAIKYFMKLKAAGHPAAKHISLRWFYINKLRDQFDGPRCIGTVRKYVREILKLDPATGKPL